jgi:hypothetical protein
MGSMPYPRYRFDICGRWVVTCSSHMSQQWPLRNLCNAFFSGQSFCIAFGKSSFARLRARRSFSNYQLSWANELRCNVLIVWVNERLLRPSAGLSGRTDGRDIQSLTWATSCHATGKWSRLGQRSGMTRLRLYLANLSVSYFQLSGLMPIPAVSSFFRVFGSLTPDIDQYLQDTANNALIKQQWRWKDG